MGELKRVFREHFESSLAEKIMQNQQYFPTVNKVSIHIIKLLQNCNITNLVEELNKVPANKNQSLLSIIKHELTGQIFFGRIMEQAIEKADALDLIKRLVNYLNNPNTEFSVIMQIHCIFVYRIYPLIAAQSEILQQQYSIKKDFVQTATADLFDDQGRLLNDNPKLRTIYGYCRNCFFQKKSAPVYAHQSAADRFISNQDSTYVQHIAKHDLPYIAGPSSHTKNLLLGVELYGKLNNEEKLEYTLACFAFLAGGGNHTFHEVYIIAKRILGIDYDIGNYQQVLPKNFICLPLYRDLATNFSQFLDPSVDTCHMNFKV